MNYQKYLIMAVVVAAVLYVIHRYAPDPGMFGLN